MLARGQLKKVSLKFLRDSLRQARGNVTLAARASGLSHDTYYRRLGIQEIQKIREEAHEWRVDMAEAHLDRKLAEGDERAVYHVLNKLGRRRGWEPGEVQIDLHADLPVRPPDWDAKRYRELLREILQTSDEPE